MTITFVTGENKIITIGPVKQSGSNLLEMILRESGRFIFRGKDEFIALSEKKTRVYGIDGTIGAGSSAEHNHTYDSVPDGQSTIFGTSDMFPQDLVQEYPVDQLEVYGLALLLDMSLSAEPGDAIGRLKGAKIQFWISRQPLTSFAQEDNVSVSLSAYQTIPEKGLSEITEGVLKTTVKKKLVPAFVPIKSSFPVDKLKDKLYLYSDVDILGYCAASTAGGNFTGTSNFEHRLIVGRGFLPEEVEELLSPSQ